VITNLAFWRAFWLAIVLVGAKVYYLGWEAADPPSGKLAFWLALSAISYADVVYATLLGCLDRAVLSIRRFPRLGRGAHAALGGLYFLSALYGLANLVVFGFFMTPLTYPLVSMASDPRSFFTSTLPFLTPPVLTIGALGVGGFAALVAGSERLAAMLPKQRVRLAEGAIALVAAVWIVCGHWQFFDGWNKRIDRRIAENAHWTFVASTVKAVGGVSQIALAVPVLDHDLDDFLTVAERAIEPVAPKSALVKKISFGAPSPARHGKTKNVIVLVLESVSARWVDLYGGPYKVTPNLAEEARHSLVLSNFYSPAGRSSDALASLLLSVQPRMSWRDVTSDYPQLPGTSLAEMLKERGYRTSFVTSSDLGWANWKGFLSDRGFDTVLQDKDLECGEPLSSWGVEDRCLVDAMLRWIPEEPGRPFFAMGWTVQTHHPYEPTPGMPLIDFFGGASPTDAYDLGRYLNVLHETDRQIGRLFTALRRAKLDDDTLVVIVGDHGEAFGEPHETYGHGTALYEENVHVPMMLWSPRLFPHGGRSPIIASHVDINQTIADVLGIPPAPTWQGRSLFDPQRRPRAYFFVANDNYQLGIREEGWKYILDATNSHEELYDLRADPEERQNVAAEHAEICQRLRQRLAARAEADRRFFSGLEASL